VFVMTVRRFPRLAGLAATVLAAAGMALTGAGAASAAACVNWTGVEPAVPAGADIAAVAVPSP
jgi:hypothetical protein